RLCARTIRIVLPPPPPRPTRFPYTTLFRSRRKQLDSALETLRVADVTPIGIALTRAGGGDSTSYAYYAQDEPGRFAVGVAGGIRSEEHTSELQSRENLVCRLLLEKKKTRSH